MEVTYIRPLLLFDQAVKLLLFNLSLLLKPTPITKTLIAIIVFTVQRAPKRWCHFPAIAKREEVFTRKITIFCSLHPNQIKLSFLI